MIGSSIISSIKLGTHAGCSSSKFSANDFKALNLKIEKIRPKLNIDYKSSRQKMYVTDKSTALDKSTVWTAQNSQNLSFLRSFVKLSVIAGIFSFRAEKMGLLHTKF